MPRDTATDVQRSETLASEFDTGQEEERLSRNALAFKLEQEAPEVLSELIARNHGVAIMRWLAGRFRERFRSGDWIVDLGIGNGWHWNSKSHGGKVLGIDMTLGNLRLARRLLRQEGHRVFLVCGDAAALPVKPASISGVWSVQVFQHLPEVVLQRALSELDRILKASFIVETHNLNPAWLQRVVSQLIGRAYHRRGRLGDKELNRLSAHEWIGYLGRLRNGRCRVSTGYSELFFHPRLSWFRDGYPVRLEHALARFTPWLAALFARQVWVRLEAE